MIKQLTLLKTCTACHAELPLESYYKDKQAADGHTGDCKSCRKARSQARMLANPKAHSERNAQWRQKNSVHVKQKKAEWLNNNPDYDREWRERNEGYQAEARNRSRAGPAAPPWLTKEHKDWMRRFYAQAALMRELTGEQWEVDHICPLCETADNPDVMGLHVPWNLQVVRGKTNRRMANKVIPWLLERKYED